MRHSKVFSRCEDALHGLVEEFAHSVDERGGRTIRRAETVVGSVDDQRPRAAVGVRRCDKAAGELRWVQRGGHVFVGPAVHEEREQPGVRRHRLLRQLASRFALPAGAQVTKQRSKLSVSEVGREEVVRPPAAEERAIPRRIYRHKPIMHLREQRARAPLCHELLRLLAHVPEVV